MVLQCNNRRNIECYVYVSTMYTNEKKASPGILEAHTYPALSEPFTMLSLFRAFRDTYSV